MSCCAKIWSWVLWPIFLLMSCQSEEVISYSRDVRPILNKHCLSCHGGIRAQGGLSFLFKEEALQAETESGLPAIVPGHARQSELVKRLRSDDPELRMPQESEPLRESEIVMIEKWIDQGAPWDEHWAYRPLVKPAIPEIDTSWGNHAIDHYIYQRLNNAGLKPTPMASPDVLARRLSFDLTGLPPDMDSIQDFLNHPDEQHYLNLIDHFLSSPHYGERFAAMWLDLARYADSNGYEKDMGRSVWRYRDWVIQSLNQDMPFDQFTIEQLAGDLLDQPTKDQLIATAFHRNTMTNTEGGTEDEEFRSMSVVDRVNTTFEVWQATTMSCVQCHSHPYDPFKLEEFYRIFALFNNTQDADLDSEYPFIMETDSVREKLQNLTAMLGDHTDHAPRSFSMITSDDLRKLMFPRLLGHFADDFQHVLISDNGQFSNSSYNSNNQKNKQYYLLYENVPLLDLEAIRFHYFCRGDDALIEVRLDSTAGPLVATAPMVSKPGKDKDWQWKTFPVSTDLEDNHDLIFCFINTTGDFRTGVVNVKEMELMYEGQQISDQIRAIQDSILWLHRQGIKTPVMRSRSKVLNRKTHIFERGNYLVKAEEVGPGVPAILSSDSTAVHDRLDLARWLVSYENPLTARVIVNRFWEQLFGRGIVETLEDFGTQGFAPSHEKLLNYLAYHFSHDWQWSTKRLLKEIVSSTTYRQSSVVSDYTLDLDPHNTFYSRGVRTRLSAEQIRDQALVVSGLLNREIGGKSVMPYQPEGVWQITYSSAKWKAAREADKYRRGLYTYWKRTTPYPSMTAFDTPSREFCVSRRITTNTPLQALVTLNDPVFIEAAEKFGKWMEAEGDGDLVKAISAGYQKALFKPPGSEVLQILLSLYAESDQPHARQVAIKPKEANKSIQPMTVVANAIMNLDAFLNKS